jgi:hypothetical protein
MHAIEQFAFGEVRGVIFGEQQADDYLPLPALVYPDGKILIEWTFTEEERARIARGENLRHWIWKDPRQPLQPVALEVTDERIA